jgi:ribosomal protein L2
MKNLVNNTFVLYKKKVFPYLTCGNINIKSGRNNSGKITVRGKLNYTKKKFRVIDFNRYL